MLISEINPFIRFAQEIVLTESTPEVSSYDHRIFYLIDGEATLCIKNDKYKIQTGSLMVWQSGELYRFLIDGKTRFIAVNFDYTQEFKKRKHPFQPTETAFFNSERISENIKFSDCACLNSPIILSRMHNIYPQIEHILKEHQKSILLSREYCSSLLKNIIIETVRSASLPSASAYGRMDKVIQYIEENYSQDISNAELASIAGYHPYHLNRLMQSYTQSTTHKYLINYRLKKSQELLINTSFTVSEISELCGFKSAYYFSNVFKENFKITPGEYRKSQKNNI